MNKIPINYYFKTFIPVSENKSTTSPHFPRTFPVPITLSIGNLTFRDDAEFTKFANCRFSVNVMYENASSRLPIFLEIDSIVNQYAVGHSPVRQIHQLKLHRQNSCHKMVRSRFQRKETTPNNMDHPILTLIRLTIRVCHILSIYCCSNT